MPGEEEPFAGCRKGAAKGRGTRGRSSDPRSPAGRKAPLVSSRSRASVRPTAGAARYLAVPLALCLPWMLLRFLPWVESPLPIALWSGLSIVGAARLLEIAHDLARQRFSQGLSLGLLVALAVLPEYAVDLYFVWKGGSDPSYLPFALANMTGANRLLLGVGWPLVALVTFFKRRRAAVALDPAHALESKLLYLISFYGFLLPFKETISLLDTLVLFGTFAYYLSKLAGEGAVEEEPKPHLEPLLALPGKLRVVLTVCLFGLAGTAVFLAAGPFAESLLDIGKGLGVSGKVLVQWVAPLASESPELLVALLLVRRGEGSLALRMLVSAKLLQWTLLVGSLPLVYAGAAGELAPLPLSSWQKEEIFLTAAFSVYGLYTLQGGQLALAEAGLILFFYVWQAVLAQPEGDVHHRSIISVALILLVILGPIFRRHERENRADSSASEVPPPSRSRRHR